MKNIPSEICNLKALEYVNILGNELTALPECIFELPKLEIINAGNNKYPENLTKLYNSKYKEGKNYFFEPHMNENYFH